MKNQQNARTGKTPSALKSLFSLITKTREGLVGFIVVAFFMCLAIIVEITNLLGVQITPYDPLAQNVGPELAPPSFSHLLGTDIVGRDAFSRIVAATPNDMAVGIVVVGAALLFGIVIGTVAAFKGGLFEELLMRATDVAFALPTLVIAMVIAVALGPGLTNMMVALVLIWWPPYARFSRGQALTIKHQNYIEAARFSGMGSAKTVVKHVIPNIITTVMVYATLDIGTVILVYAGLSYLGLSVRPPYPDWGEMISSMQDYLLTAPWLPIFPGLIISAIVVGFSLLGDGIKEALEAR